MTKKLTDEELEQRVSKLECRIQELEQVESERKLAVEKLRESEAKYKRVSDNSPAVLYQFMINSNGVYSFLYVSNTAVSIFGVLPEDVLKDSSILLSMVHPEDQKMFHQGIMRSSETLESFPLTFRCKKDGEMIWIEARGTPTPMKDGSILWDGFLIDVTERIQAEQEKEKVIKKLEEALSEVKILGGLLPICSHCKKIRDDKGYWEQIEDYIQEHSEAEFSHSICRECAKKYYPDMDIYDEDDSQE